MGVNIHPSWLAQMSDEFDKAYFRELTEFVRSEYQKYRCFPPGKEIFSAFDHTPFDQVKVVILGQDPYHGPGQAHGLCFSVREGVVPPPSLVNIYKEIKADLGKLHSDNGDLTNWADQGVLLLNATLTVRAHQAGSHQNRGWEQFTDRVISELSAKREGLIFMLWGGYAKRKGRHIDTNRHLVLSSGHPSPLSANRGYWFGNRHFSTANNYLEKRKEAPIIW
ncbi:uracil-DNA glycosylase [Aureitalea marina]|uniref:Uracil-DNA glycosylase n=1 Tax=Aureitalea marina TaxID=930804 RepID=A0A2S7KP69_9FLAO|nr:uracil-DNA glycosylase [Aureitalea marina]PQB04378.1 uracil-DNA glycosylase [Aureitalea marina]